MTQVWPGPADTTAPPTIRFGGIRIEYAPETLQPRPWTTAQAHWAAIIAREAPPGRVLELCAGVGQIGLLTIALARRRLVAVDRNPVAGALIERNASEAGLADRVDVRLGDLEDVLAASERFPIILADPPWVPSAEIGRFPDDPPVAIDGGSDGLALARRCVRVIAAHLAPGGSAVLQLGSEAQVANLIAELPRGLAASGMRSFRGKGVLVRLQHRDATDSTSSAEQET